MLTRRNLLGLSLGACLAGVPGLTLAANDRPRSRQRSRRASAFTHVTVVPMDRERLLEDHTVIVRHGRIVAVGPTDRTPVPDGAEIIDGRGKFLMPGLADMHVHLRRHTDLILYLANGVTTVRNMGGHKSHLRWRQGIESGKLLGPAISTAGPIFEGRTSRSPTLTPAKTVAQAVAQVAEQKAAGFDFIKLYDHIQPDIYRAVLKAARAHEMPVVGHVPFSVGFDEAIAAGQHSIEHLSGFATLIQRKDSPYRDKTGWVDRVKAFGHLDETRMDAVARAIRDAGVWSCPTLVATERLVPRGQPRPWLSRPEMRHIGHRTRLRWRRVRWRGTTWDADAARHAVQLRLRMTGALHKAGAKLLLGTDAMSPFVVPGFTLHDELANLVAAGLSPFEALSTGTSNAGEFLGRSIGLVAVGQRADLVLLEADPLKAVENIRHRAGVMARGRWRTWEELAQMLDDHAEKVEARRRSRRRRKQRRTPK